MERRMDKWRAGFIHIHPDGLIIELMGCMDASMVSISML
jgi:hypothetical protein